MTQCPVVKAIGEIRGGGLYEDDTEDSTDRVIKLGGGDCNVEFVLDDMSFYMMQRKMELARFELSKPPLAACEAKYKKMFRDVAGNDYIALYTKIIDRVAKNYLYDQFVKLVDLIENMEQLIASQVAIAGRKRLPINISIPDIFLLPHIDRLIIYRPDILTVTVNKIIDYMNKINVNALLKEPIRIQISHVEKFTGVPPDMKTKIPEINVKTAEELLAGMHVTLEHEMKVSGYIREIEKYQCDVINHLNQVYDACKKIITAIV